MDTTTNTPRAWTADAIIQRALTNERPDLGISDREASLGMDLIIASGREDDDALTAHDLLHERATFGRAF
jgi:hypothetical protein